MDLSKDEPSAGATDSASTASTAAASPETIQPVAMASSTDTPQANDTNGAMYTQQAFG